MKLAILKIEAKIPQNYSWTCVDINDQDAKIWKFMGHTVVEVPEEKGKELLKRAWDAINLQYELAILEQEQERKDQGMVTIK